MSIRAKHVLLSWHLSTSNSMISEFPGPVPYSPLSILSHLQDLYQAETIKHWHFWRQRSLLSLCISNHIPGFKHLYTDVALAVIFHQGLWSLPQSSHLRTPPESAWPRLNLWATLTPQTCDPKLILPSEFSNLREDIAILPIKQARNLGIYSKNLSLSYYTGNSLPTSADFSLFFINFESYSFFVVNHHCRPTRAICGIGCW